MIEEGRAFFYYELLLQLNQLSLYTYSKILYRQAVCDPSFLETIWYQTSFTLEVVINQINLSSTYVTLQLHVASNQWE